MGLIDRVFAWLPFVVLWWMMFGALLVFTRQAGEQSPRGLGIAISVWSTLALSRTTGAAPFLIQLVGAAGLLVALALYQWAALSIRGRVFSYAGNTDLPVFVHSAGPYIYIRNPFYLSYLLAEISTVVLWPSRLGVAVVVFATAYFHWLVRFEEQKFERSPTAGEYATYKAATGRFLPRLRGHG